VGGEESVGVKDFVGELDGGSDNVGSTESVGALERAGVLEGTSDSVGGDDEVGWTVVSVAGLEVGHSVGS